MRAKPTDAPPAGYNLPQQPWVCGHSDAGQPCPLGPLRGGRCAHLGECRPVQVDHGQWECSRAPSRGGPCEVGPTSEGGCGCVHSCTPRASLRATRGRWLRALLVASLGIVLMTLGSAWRESALVPGDLASHHAQVLHGSQWDSRCAACHMAGTQSSPAWLAAAVWGHSVGPTQSTLCMQCHDQSLDTEHALTAHSMNPAELVALASFDQAGEARPPNEQQLACSTCHQEHHGANHNLSLMSDARCQACHQTSYDHFAGTHPELGSWPYVRRTAIAFDHAGHAAKHFAVEKQTFDCRTCHVPSDDGRTQLTLGFDQACASCHTERMTIAGQQGLALLSIPIIDTDVLADAGHDIAWPEDAIGDFDGVIPPAMQLLLAGDPQVAEALKHFGSAIDFFDVDPDAPEDVRAVAALASAIDRLTTELAADPQQAVATRLGLDPVDAATVAGLLGTLSPQDASSARAAWFDGQAAPESIAAPGSWNRDDGRLSLAYTPTGHADPVLKAWFELAVSLPAGPQRDMAITALGGPKSVGTCGTCHTVEQTASGSLQVQWKYRSHKPSPNLLTHFSHKPHTLQPELETCRHCHTPRAEAVATHSLLEFNPTVFVSDFEPVTKAACATCHQPHRATSSCTTCHFYHAPLTRSE